MAFSFTNIPAFLAQISNGETTCTEAVLHYLAVIKQKSSLNALIAVFAEEALKKASLLDQKLAAGEIACAWEQLPYPLILRQRRPSDGAWIDQALKQNGVPRIFGTRWPVLSGPLPGDKALVAVGLAAHSSVAFDGSGRCLSVKNRLVESLNALPLRC